MLRFQTEPSSPPEPTGGPRPDMKTILRQLVALLTVAWRPLAAVWLLTCLAVLTAGFWPDALVYPKTPTAAVPLPTLPALAVAQGLFLLIVYPLAVIRRYDSTGTKFCPGLATIELCLLFITAVPFYVAAGYFSDASTIDVLRIVLCLLALLPLTIAACTWTQKKCEMQNAECGIPAQNAPGDAGDLRSPSGRDGSQQFEMRNQSPGNALPGLNTGNSSNPAARTLILLIMLTITLAMPAGVYICKEFLQPAWADALWNIAPLTFLWTSAHAAPALLPTPVSTLIAWPLLGMAAITVRWMQPNKR